MSRDLNELLPEARGACSLFLAECKKRNIPIFITQTYRPQEEQNELYARGRSKPGVVVTWTLKSKHTDRLAWDIASEPKNVGELYHTATLEKAGEVAKELGIEWGGTWDAPDMPHFQIKKGQIVTYKGDDEVVEQISVKLNGVVKKIDVIKKDGFNYVKLQDIKDHFIDITYDATGKLPIIEARA